MKRTAEELREKFYNSHVINPTNDCWEWTGAINAYGYAVICGWRANRLCWALKKGKIPKGKQVCHKCDNRKCVNPDHLWLGTGKQNMQDCSKKGRISLIGAKKASSLNIGRKMPLKARKKLSKARKAFMNSPAAEASKNKSAESHRTPQSREKKRQQAIKQWKDKKERIHEMGNN